MIDPLQTSVSITSKGSSCFEAAFNSHADKEARFGARLVAINAHKTFHPAATESVILPLRSKLAIVRRAREIVRLCQNLLRSIPAAIAVFNSTLG